MWLLVWRLVAGMIATEADTPCAGMMCVVVDIDHSPWFVCADNGLASSFHAAVLTRDVGKRYWCVCDTSCEASVGLKRGRALPTC